MSNWLEELQAAVKGSSLAVIAERLGFSRTTISMVCNGKYKGNLDNVRERVESVLLGKSVICPILGQIPAHQCKAHQARRAGDVSSAPNEIKLYKACRSGCPHSQLAQEELLERPMRLPVQIIEPEPVAVAYDAEAMIGRLRRQARSDSGDNQSRQQQLFTKLLEEELRMLAIKFNRSQRHKENHS